MKVAPNDRCVRWKCGPVHVLINSRTFLHNGHLVPLSKIDFESFKCPKLRHFVFFFRIQDSKTKAEIPAHEDNVMNICFQGLYWI